MIQDFAAGASNHAKVDGRVDRVGKRNGVSVGERDYVTDALQALGHLEFWRLNLKPGKPVAVANVDGCWFFGLPGNPVSTAITGLLIALPALRHLAGAEKQATFMLRATLDAPIRHREGREEYQRGYVRLDGNNLVTPTGDQSSNRLASFAQANCLIRVPKQVGDLPAGTDVEILPLRQLLAP